MRAGDLTTKLPKAPDVFKNLFYYFFGVFSMSFCMKVKVVIRLRFIG